MPLSVFSPNFASRLRNLARNQAARHQWLRFHKQTIVAARKDHWSALLELANDVCRAFLCRNSEDALPRRSAALNARYLVEFRFDRAGSSFRNNNSC